MNILKDIKYLGIGIAALIGILVFAVIAFVIIGLSISSYHGKKNTNYLANQFINLANQNNIKYSNKECINNNIDTPDYCSFTVSAKGSVAISNTLTSTLKAAGYSISSNESGTIATNKGLNMYLDYSAQPNQATVVVHVSLASNPY